MNHVEIVTQLVAAHVAASSEHHSSCNSIGLLAVREHYELIVKVASRVANEIIKQDESRKANKFKEVDE